MRTELWGSMKCAPKNCVIVTDVGLAKWGGEDIGWMACNGDGIPLGYLLHPHVWMPFEPPHRATLIVQLSLLKQELEHLEERNTDGLQSCSHWLGSMEGRGVSYELARKRQQVRELKDEMRRLGYE